MCQNVERYVFPLTAVQAVKAVEICQMFSNTYRDIHLFRFDPLTGNIYILAGEGLGVLIDQDANWEFDE